jgi:hypothetical protein
MELYKPLGRHSTADGVFVHKLHEKEAVQSSDK